MTLEVRTVDADTFDPLSFDEAVALTDQIRVNVADLEWKIVHAYYGQAWKALEYSSWDEYVAGEFKSAPLAMPREERRTQVASLRQQGLSMRAIGAVTGTSEPTARRDWAESTASNDAVEDGPERITGLDGRERPATRPSAPPSEVRDTPPRQEEACPTCGQIMPADLRKEG